MNNFIVRFTIFFCTIYFGIVLYFAWNGEYVFDDLYKVFLEYCLFIFASENHKYHCKYAIFLALNLCFTDLITWINTTFSIVNETINNNHIGYNRDKVIALKNKLRKEYDERKLKQLNKERRNKSKGGFN